MKDCPYWNEDKLMCMKGGSQPPPTFIAFCCKNNGGVHMDTNEKCPKLK